MNEVFKALADPTRRKILQILRQGERSAGELAAFFPLNKSTLSGHFAILRAAALIHGERRGTVIVYRLNTTIFQEVMAGLMELFQPLGDTPLSSEKDEEAPHS